MFERLTADKVYLNSIRFGIQVNFPPHCGHEKAKEVDDFVKNVFDRLAAYEDSNLSPDEVQELAKAKAEGRLVEVVRCGECRHYNTTGCSDGCGWCENMDRGVFDEHYCSRGERRKKE